jgi:hypothetical protein
MALRRACGRATAALSLLHEYGVALGWPGSRHRPPAWDATTVRIVLEVHAALGELIAARREYDRLARARGMLA